MADKDFLLSESDFQEKKDVFKIEDFKKATTKQLKDVQVVQDYVFCNLLTSSRLSSLEPQNLTNYLKVEERTSSIGMEDELQVGEN